MWLEEAEELFKGYLPYYVLIVLPIFIIISPANPVLASHEFPVYRMQHFDLHGVAHGSRSAAVNLEARSLTGWSTSRHCVIVKLQDLTIDHFRNIRAKAGALLVVLPNDLSGLNSDEKQHLLLLEQAMLAQEISVPVYFAIWTGELETIVDEVSQNVATNDLSKSAAEAMFSSVAANGYQFVVSPGTTNVKQDVKVATIQGHLSGYSQEGKIPTLAVVAHYDSFGVAPNLSFGADSNGSGVVILLELARLFSNLYSDPKTRGKYNLVFLLTGGGKINYQGSKKWLEDQLDSLDGSIIQDASFVMCLDTLASGDSLYMHVSKPPKDGSPASLFFKELKAAADQFPTTTVDGVHKKINLADDILAWEHERYSIRRLPAFTLSTLKSHRELTRGTILDTRKNLNVEKLNQNTKVIAEALANFVYNTSLSEIFGGSLDVDKSYLEAWINYLTSQPRATQLLSNKDNALVTFLKDNFNKYLRDVKVSYAVPDKRDPDFLFYDVTKGVVNVYGVKPAIFDLVLTFAIILYLGTVYLFVQKFPALYSTACSLTSSKPKQN
ncbi:Nicalin-1-like Protein [Tribolium castaneum]|uniref:Nicalin n=1 Tax=Tribolium castaneum TaxID=7070 RepID=D6WSR0_TRICA|nr:PREDICTED: nicalin-1 [Tribolium castaneum]EFA05879.1 Nicalin-1-like Protein [Tribolium castaneum]|eukprot:XP_971811.1 PREDICTED: nicalin-1 [Tribolium castaneum]